MAVAHYQFEAIHPVTDGNGRTGRILNLLIGAGLAKRQTASEYLKQLAAIGMLSEIKVGREKLFLHPNFMRLLTSDDHTVPAYGDGLA